MSTYVMHAACRGKKPQQIVGATVFLRNALLARMMRDRSRVRYLIAPTGFGKTLLAGSYVNMVNGYENTFWLNAQSPCFLRDLDANVLATDILEASQDGDVVVFDDMPAMDKRRCRQAWTLCHRLLSAGREVVVCTTPAANPLRINIKACLVISPTDFLYQDKDFDELKSVSLDARYCQPPVFPSDRVACLAQHTPGAYERFLMAYIEDVGSAREIGLTFVLLVLAKGSIDDVVNAMDCALSIADISADFHRPFVNVNEFFNEFDASDYPMREIARAFGPYLHRLAPALNARDAGTLVQRLANVLMAQGNPDRAVQLVRAMGLPAVRARWLRENQKTLIDSGFLVAGEMLYESLRGTRYWKDAALAAASGIRRCILGDAPAASDLIRFARREKIPLNVRLQASAVAFLHTDDANAGKDIAKEFAQDTADFSDEDAESSQTRELAACWKTLAYEHDFVCPRSPLALAVVLKAHSLKLGISIDVDDIADSYRCVVARVKAEGTIDAASMLLMYQVQRVPISLRRHLLRVPGQKEIEALYAHLADRIHVQKTAYERICLARTVSDAASRTAAFSHQTAGSLPHTPQMRVTLFGQFGVRFDDAPVEHRAFRRSKVRSLLGVLVLESGRELSSERISCKLWPDSSPARARHNLHTTVSLLRNALTLPGGECPYLRTKTGIVSIDEALVGSDAADLDVLCRKLRFDEPDEEVFARILEQIRALYGGEFLPGDDNTLVISTRRAWIDKVVSALSTGARRLAHVGSEGLALQMAQQALDVDPGREDCYEMLMSMQARMGQRRAAIDTWFSYCNYLDDELGLEPSQRAEQLYSRIISAQ